MSKRSKSSDLVGVTIIATIAIAVIIVIISAFYSSSETISVDDQLSCWSDTRDYPADLNINYGIYKINRIGQYGVFYSQYTIYKRKFPYYSIAPSFKKHMIKVDCPDWYISYDQQEVEYTEPKDLVEDSPLSLNTLTGKSRPIYVKIHKDKKSPSAGK